MFHEVNSKGASPHGSMALMDLLQNMVLFSVNISAKAHTHACGRNVIKSGTKGKPNSFETTALKDLLQQCKDCKHPEITLADLLKVILMCAVLRFLFLYHTAAKIAVRIVVCFSQTNMWLVCPLACVYVCVFRTGW